jgi:hypothetical protein
MNEKTWLVVHTAPGKPNIVCGPFVDSLEAMTFVHDEFSYTGTSLHNTLESAMADDSKWDFVKAV